MTKSQTALMPWRGFRASFFVIHSAFVILASLLANASVREK